MPSHLIHASRIGCSVLIHLRPAGALTCRIGQAVGHSAVSPVRFQGRASLAVSTDGMRERRGVGAVNGRAVTEGR